MRLERIHHVSLNVRDVAEAERFYTEVLGLRPLPRPDFGFPGCWLDAGEQQIHLIEQADHSAPEGQYFAFEVADLEATIAQLAQRGAQPSRVFDLPGAGRQAFLRDPSGNLIELNQPSKPGPPTD